MNIFDLKIGFKCNNNCVHCVVADKRNTKDLSLDELFNIIKNDVPEGYMVQITGGEPTIYPYFLDILKLCKKYNHCTVIQTNGTGFSDLDLVKACKPYIDQVHIAIHSCIPEVHDRIVGTTGMWEKTYQGFKNLISQDIFLTTQTVLSKYNISSLYETYKFIQSERPGTLMNLTYPHLMGNALKNQGEVAFRYKDYKDIISNCLRDFHENLFVEEIPYCYLHPYVNEVFTMAKDLIQKIDRVGIDTSSSESYKDYNILNIEDHRKGPLCQKCVYNKYCIGVWKEYIDLFKNRLDLYPVTIEE